MMRRWLALALACLPLAGAWAQQAPLLLAEGPRWQDLSPAQQQVLRPMQRDWSRVDEDSKRQWLGVASRFDQLSPAERARAQQRMDEWARMPPAQRDRARLNYRGALELSPSERRERWEAYQRLSEEQRRGLAKRGSAQYDGPGDGKSNLVPVPPIGAPHPGVTTTPLAARPAPPLHQQPGLPKVAATPGFVDQRTLLPQRGAQGAAIEPRRGSNKPSARGR